jgi:hypothetical protein
MHLSLSLWCAILSFTTAQELSDSTSTSTNAAVPWITYTSTRHHSKPSYDNHFGMTQAHVSKITY